MSNTSKGQGEMKQSDAKSTSTANGHSGGEVQSQNGRRSSVKNEDGKVVQGDYWRTVNGDMSWGTTGMFEWAAEWGKLIVGSKELYESGNVAAENRRMARYVATVAQSGNNKGATLVPSKEILNFMSAIAKATVSIDTTVLVPPRPTGFILKDIENMSKYYVTVMKQFTLKNTAKKALLAVYAETERFEKQWELTMDVARRIGEKWERIFEEKAKEDPNAKGASVATENANGEETATNEDALRAAPDVNPDTQK